MWVSTMFRSSATRPQLFARMKSHGEIPRTTSKFDFRLGPAFLSSTTALVVVLQLVYSSCALLLTLEVGGRFTSSFDAFSSDRFYSSFDEEEQRRQEEAESTRAKLLIFDKLLSTGKITEMMGKKTSISSSSATRKKSFRPQFDIDHGKYTPDTAEGGAAPNFLSSHSDPQTGSDPKIVGLGQHAGAHEDAGAHASHPNDRHPEQDALLVETSATRNLLPEDEVPIEPEYDRLNQLGNVLQLSANITVHACADVYAASCGNFANFVRFLGVQVPQNVGWLYLGQAITLYTQKLGYWVSWACTHPDYHSSSLENVWFQHDKVFQHDGGALWDLYGNQGGICGPQDPETGERDETKPLWGETDVNGILSKAQFRSKNVADEDQFPVLKAAVGRYFAKCLLHDSAGEVLAVPYAADTFQNQILLGRSAAADDAASLAGCVADVSTLSAPVVSGSTADGAACQMTRARFARAVARMPTGSMFGVHVGHDARDGSQRILELTGLGFFPELRATYGSYAFGLFEEAVQTYVDIATTGQGVWQKTIYKYYAQPTYTTWQDKNADGIPDDASYYFGRKVNVTRTFAMADELSTAVPWPFPSDNITYVSLVDLEKLAPSFEWRVYFETLFDGVVDIAESTNFDIDAITFQVRNIQYFAKLSEVLEVAYSSVSGRATLVDLLALQFFFDFGSAMSTGMQSFQAEFMLLFTGQTGTSTRLAMCHAWTEALAEWPLAQAYVLENFPESSKILVRQIAQDMKDVFLDSLSEVSWLDADGRKKAEEKANAMGLSIGYPDWLDGGTAAVNRLFDMLQLRGGDHLVTSARLRKTNPTLFDLMWIGKEVQQLQNLRDVARLKVPYDRLEDWTLSPLAGSAYYHFAKNKIVFPAGFLIHPIYEPSLSLPYLYGSLGWIMGHEITHGFDWEGSKFDALGNIVAEKKGDSSERGWFSDPVAQTFQKRAQCFVQQAEQESLFGVSMNGERMRDENIADQGGVSLAIQAYFTKLLPRLSLDRRRELERLQYTVGSPRFAGQGLAQELVGVRDSDNYYYKYQDAPKNVSHAQMLFLGMVQPLQCEAYNPKAMAFFLQNHAVHSPGVIRARLAMRNTPAFAEVFHCPTTTNKKNTPSASTDTDSPSASNKQTCHLWGSPNLATLMGSYYSSPEPATAATNNDGEVSSMSRTPNDSRIIVAPPPLNEAAGNTMVDLMLSIGMVVAGIFLLVIVFVVGIAYNRRMKRKRAAAAKVVPIVPELVSTAKDDTGVEVS